MNTHKLHVKPLTAAIAVTLCLGFSGGAIAKDTVSANATAQVTATTQSDTQSGQTNAKKCKTGKAGEKCRQRARLTLAQLRAVKLQDVKVTGIAGSNDRDLILKRYANQVEDSITAQEIGQLPDVTITDALSRIPGVTIGRSGGEGTTVEINGNSNVQQTLNGEIFLSPGGGSNLSASTAGAPDLASGTPDFVDVPATLFKSANVIKSTTASDVSGGISGIVNLNTHYPFDFKKGWTATGSVQGNWSDLAKHLNKLGSFLVNWHNDRWGWMLTGSYGKELIANEAPHISAYDSGEETTEADVGFDFNGDGVIGNSLDPNKIPKDYYYQWDPKLVGTELTQRKRLGLDGAFEYKFSDSLKLKADALYTHFNELDTAYSYQLQDDSTPGNLQPGPIKPVITPEGVLLSGINKFDQLTQFTDIGHGPSMSLNTNLKLDYDAGGFFSGSLRWVHGSASRRYTTTGEDSNANQGSLLPLPDGSFGYDNPNGVPNGVPVYQNYTGKYPVTYIMEDVTDPAKWVLTSAYAAQNKINSNLNVFRGDGTLHFESGMLHSIKFGARYQHQTYAYNQGYFLTPISPKGACADPLGPGPNDALYRFVDPRVIDACTGFSEIPRKQLTELPPGWLAFFNHFDPQSFAGVGETGRGYPIVNPKVMMNPVEFLEKVAPQATGKPKLYQEPTASYAVHEKIVSAYTQLNFSGPLFGMVWHSNIGVNAVKTMLYIGSYKTVGGSFYGNGGSFNGVLINHGKNVFASAYTKFLPSFNFSLNVTPDQKLRLAWTRTQARQSLSDLGQGRQVFYSANGNPPQDPSLPQSAQLFESATSGNPHLKPYRSTNYNASYGWYFAPHSLLYLGAFFSKVASFPENTTINICLPDADGVQRRCGPESTLVNGGRSDNEGLEGQFRTQFTWLPGWMSGLGTNLNYTFRTNTNKGAATSSSYNAILFYQKHKLQVRFAYKWRKHHFIESNLDLNDEIDIYAKSEGYLDASLIYGFTPNIALDIQATNLTNSYDYEYAQYRDAFWTEDISGRRYYVGVRVIF